MKRVVARGGAGRKNGENRPNMFSGRCRLVGSGEREGGELVNSAVAATVAANVIAAPSAAGAIQVAAMVGGDVRLASSQTFGARKACWP